MPALLPLTPLASNWGLPPLHSQHGGDIDGLFGWIFWITLAAFALVEVALIVFLIGYRSRPGRRATFTHGNRRLEVAWTLAPVLVFAGLALASKRVWDDYRQSPAARDPARATILVIAQQFQWNFVYPGPDGVLGRYLRFPRPTDPSWPGGTKFAGTDGPADLSHDKAVDAINRYIALENPLGKDLDDPAGKDDDWAPQPGRPLYVPADRPVEVRLASVDVIHSFYLPEHRVKLDAVPGMTGRVVFTATTSSRAREDATLREYALAELVAALADPANRTLTVRITETSPGATQFKQGRTQFWRYTDAERRTILRDGNRFGPDAVAKLRAAGIERVSAYRAGEWEIACAELCGLGHSRMRGTMVVLDQAEYATRFETAKVRGASVKDSDGR